MLLHPENPKYKQGDSHNTTPWGGGGSCPLKLRGARFYQGRSKSQPQTTSPNIYAIRGSQIHGDTCYVPGGLQGAEEKMDNKMDEATGLLEVAHSAVILCSHHTKDRPVPQPAPPCLACQHPASQPLCTQLHTTTTSAGVHHNLILPPQAK